MHRLRWLILSLLVIAADQATKLWVLAVRTAVGKHLELARKAGAIGSALDAELDLYCDASLQAQLAKLEDELRFVLITSYARVHPIAECPADAAATDLPGVAVRITPSACGKCVRCWHHREDVGANATHPELCGRCVTNVEGPGEVRKYA